MDKVHYIYVHGDALAAGERGKNMPRRMNLQSCMETLWQVERDERIKSVDGIGITTIIVYCTSSSFKVWCLYNFFDYIDLKSRGLTAWLWLFKKKARPKPSWSCHYGPAWPGLFGPGLAWLTASGRALHHPISNWYSVNLMGVPAWKSRTGIWLVS